MAISIVFSWCTFFGLAEMFALRGRSRIGGDLQPVGVNFVCALISVPDEWMSGAERIMIVSTA